MSATLSSRIELPAGFRHNDVLAFHRRDAQQIAERIDGQVLQKGLCWEGHPACLTFRFDAAFAIVELAVDGTPADGGQEQMERMARRMLGLTQRIEDFEQAYRTHPQVGTLIARNSGLRVALASTPFEALSWAITGQQISVSGGAYMP